VVLQAFIDDSASNGGTFVLAGYIASAEQWAAFAPEWESLLPLATRGSNKQRFKMSEMGGARMQHVPKFYGLAEKYAAFAISCKIDVGDLARAFDRIWIDGVHIDFARFSRMNNPYFVTFWKLLECFHVTRLQNPRLMPADVSLSEVLPLDQKIDFYFDEHSAKNSILEVWNLFLNDIPEETRALFGHMPRFEDDECFMPLQAADFWAWWVRKGHEDGKLREYEQARFPTWTGTKPVPGIMLELGEDELVQHLIYATRINLAHQHGDEAKSIAIYDAKYHPRPGALETNGSAGLSLAARLLRWLRGG
jgi:hypothetical protein